MRPLSVVAVIYLAEAAVFAPAVYVAATHDRWWIVGALTLAYVIASGSVSIKAESSKS